MSKISVPYTELWAATDRRRRDAAQPTPRRSTAPIDDDNVELADRVRRPAGRQAAADGLPRRHRAERSAVRAADRTRAEASSSSAVRVNQVGYLPGLAKIATVATPSRPAPLDWQLVDKAGKMRASGKTRPFGDDKSSGERVQQIDFSSFDGRRQGLQAAGRQATRACRSTSATTSTRSSSTTRSRSSTCSAAASTIKMPYAGSKAYERPGRPRRRQERAVLRRRRSATTRWTSAAAGTTPATTASTWSTAASRSGRCRTSTRC